MKHSLQKTILCDFDGVLHSYVSGWQGARVIADPPVDGAIDWLVSFLENYCDVPEAYGAMAPPGEFKFCIYSSRSHQWGGLKAMKQWLVTHGLAAPYLEVLSFPIFKPPAWLTIDDRAICFMGVFPTVEQIRNFKPWYTLHPPTLDAPRSGFFPFSPGGPFSVRSTK
jgi:hypothetical protein